MQKSLIAALTGLVLASSAQGQLNTGNWSFGLQSGASFPIGKSQQTLFRSNSVASRFFANYQSGWAGIGVSTGLLPGTVSQTSINQFLSDRKIQAGTVSIASSNPMNSYFAAGPSFQFGHKFQVQTQLQGGVFFNDPGGVNIVQNGATRSLYRFDGASKNLNPGFAGSLQLAYPLTRTTRFTFNTDFLHTRSSIRLIDLQNGIDQATEQKRTLQLFTAGIGIVKVFGKDKGSGMASGKRVLPTVNKREIAIDEAGVHRSIISPRDPQSGLPTGQREFSIGEPGVQVTEEITIDEGGVHRSIVSPRDAQSGLPTGRRVLPTVNKREFSIGEPGVQSTVQNNCGGVTEKVTNPDGSVVERSFACPDDAYAFNQALKTGQMPNRISMNVTTPKQTQGATFGEKVNSGMHQAGSALANGTGLRVISGRLVKGAAGNSSGILTNAVSAVGNLSGGGSGAAAASYARMAGSGSGGLTVVLYSREAGSGMATGRRSREAGSGMATGRRQYQPIFNENGGGDLQPEQVEVKSNPLYQGNNKEGSNPMYDKKAAGGPDNDCDGVSGVLVELIDAGSGTVAATTVTGACGEFWFARVPDGNYMVHLTGTVTARKSYDLTLKGSQAQDIAGAIQYPNEQWNLILNNGNENESRINTSRSNIKNIVVVEADTDGDGAFDQVSALASFNDGSSKDITTQCAISRTADGGKEISIPLQPGNSQRAGKAKYKNIVLKRSASGDGFSADAEKLEGGKEGIATKVAVTEHPGVIQYQINTADLDGDGAADLIWSPRSNVNPESGMRKGWDGTVKGLAVSAGDLDGDGQAELLVGGSLPGGSVISSALRPGNPIGGISIKGGKNPGGNFQGRRTNASGEFEFTDWAPGTYRIEAALNYEIDATINIAAGDVNGDGISERKGWDGTIKGSGYSDADPANKAFNQNSSRSNHTYRNSIWIEADTDGDGTWETRFLNFNDEMALLNITEPGAPKAKVVEKATSGLKDTLKTQVRTSGNSNTNNNDAPLATDKWSADAALKTHVSGDPHVDQKDGTLYLDGAGGTLSVAKTNWRSAEAGTRRLAFANNASITVAGIKNQDYPTTAAVSLNGLPPGEPIIRAAVQLSTSTGKTYTVLTDEAGMLSLNGLPPGVPLRVRVNVVLAGNEDLLLVNDASGNLQLRKARHDIALNAIRNMK